MNTQRLIGLPADGLVVPGRMILLMAVLLLVSSLGITWLSGWITVDNDGMYLAKGLPLPFIFCRGLCRRSWSLAGRRNRWRVA